MSPSDEETSPRLTESCWPIFEFLTNFIRQVKHGTTPSGQEVHFEALSAIRDTEDLTRNEPVAERAWHNRVKAMMVYLLDYMMLNTEWPGQAYWFDNQFETDPQVLDHAQALGGEEFFRNCDAIQREYELAERRDRRDKNELAEILNLYFICLRLGFKGQYHDRPQELADYTRRLFTRLPAYASTRGKEMFADAYRSNEEVKVNYNLGTRLMVVLTTFIIILCVFGVTFRVAWDRATGDIAKVAVRIEAGAQPISNDEESAGEPDDE